MRPTRVQITNLSGARNRVVVHAQRYALTTAFACDRLGLRLRPGALLTAALTWAIYLASCSPALAQAAEIVNPRTLSWTAPTTSVDGTPLTDLGAYNVKVGQSPTGPFVTRKVVPSPTTTPAPGTVVTVGSPAAPIGTELSASDGHFWVVISAVDTALNEGPNSVSTPFGRNLVAPAAPTSPVFAP